MSNQRIGACVLTLESCQNSMDAAKFQLADLAHGTVLHIKNLASARGRQGRIWQLMPGQFLMTFVLKPEQKLLQRENALPSLFMALSLGVLEPLKKYDVGLKWPNDLVMQGKKLAGILMESVWQGNGLQGLVVGFAVNVNNQFEADNSLQKIAISLRAVYHQEFDLHELEQQFLQSLNHFYDQWVAGSFKDLFLAWQEAQYCIGKQISVHHADGSVVCGVMQGVTEKGDLVLKDGAGNEHIILYAQVLQIEVDSF